jgi:16S rRNA (uracil1498-N3)-methyltransferase
MKIHRFIDDFDLNEKASPVTGLRPRELEISGDIAHQIIKVLKLETGEKIELCDGKETLALGEIKEIGKKNVIVKIISTKKEKNDAKKVSLFCAVLKKENFELVVQKATEVGVYKIIPIISARTIKTGLNLERLNKIAKEASEQSGRISVPEILEPISLENALKAINKNDANILFDGSGEHSFEIHAYSPTGELLCSPRQSAQCISNECSPNLEDKFSRTNIFIGPEGGWTKEEIKKARSADFKIINLGNLTLRGETAAIISSYLAVNYK